MVQGRAPAGAGLVLGAGALIKIVRVLTALIAAILALHIALVVFEASPDNTVADHTADLAAKLNLGIDHVFTPQGPKARVLLNDGLAALIWLVVSACVTKIIAVAVRTSLAA